MLKASTTRFADPRRSRQARVALEFDDGTFLVARGHGLIGREPHAHAGERTAHLVKLADPSCKVSRTHLEFGLGTTGLWVRDRHSTNGSEIEFHGRRMRLDPGQVVSVRPASTIHLGGRRIRVRSVDIRAVVGPVTLEWGAATRVGLRRGHNQDSFGARPPVFVVADGIGTHSAGNLASREAVQALLELAGRQPVTAEMFSAALADARARIARIPVLEAKRPPGTTLSGVIVTVCDDKPCWMVVNVGDSRTYRLDASGLRQLTVDHSIAQTLIDRGVIAKESTGRLPLRNMLNRAVFGEIEHEADVWQLSVRSGDRILVCSDGLPSTVDDAAIARALRVQRDPQVAADALVDMATQAGGRDDVTVVVVDAVAVGKAVSWDGPTAAIKRTDLAADIAGNCSTVTRARWRGDCPRNGI